VNSYCSRSCRDGPAPQPQIRPTRNQIQLEPGVSYIAVGNPGTGKSAILNSLAGSVHFQSGFSAGRGKTYKLDECVTDHGTFMDTPGLADPELRQKAAKAIEEALKKGGKSKIFFVITLESGRVSPQDVTTMSIILQSCSSIQSDYGIIINKVHPKAMGKVNNNIKTITAQIFSCDNVKATALIHVNPFMDELNEEENVYLGASEDMLSFMQTIPAVDINPADVRALDFSDFQAKMDQQTEMIVKLMADRDAMNQQMMKQQQVQMEQITRLTERLADMRSQPQVVRVDGAENGGSLGSLFSKHPLLGSLF